MKTLAVLYICTGAYVAFWRDFYPNFKANFLPDCDRTFFVFTDADHIAYEDAPDVRRIPQQALPWPYSTMQRFDAFLGQEAALAKFDYLFFANANLHCTRVISAAELLPDPAAGQTLTAVCHLPYYGRAPMFHPYDRSGKSRASIPYNCGQYYVAGGLNGGTAAAFLALCRELKARTDEDLQHGVIARFHDESQLNRLVAEAPQYFRILPPDYCTPEETPTGHEAILVLQKSRFIQIDASRTVKKPQSFPARKWEAFCLNWLPYLWRAYTAVTGTTTGVLLFVRVTMLVLKAVLSVWFYRSLRAPLGRTSACLLALVPFVFTPKWFLGPDYVSQQFHFTLAAFLFFYGYYAPGPRQYRGLWRVAAGAVCACFSFLAYPQSAAAARCSFW